MAPRQTRMDTRSTRVRIRRTNTIYNVYTYVRVQTHTHTHKRARRMPGRVCVYALYKYCVVAMSNDTRTRVSRTLYITTIIAIITTIIIIIIVVAARGSQARRLSDLTRTYERYDAAVFGSVYWPVVLRVVYVYTSACMVRC